MAALINATIDLYDYCVQNSDPRTAHMAFMSSPLGILALVFGYVYFTTSLGPWLMENRQAFECKTAMTLYNVVQIVTNGIMFIQIMRVAWFSGKISLTCGEMDYSDDPYNLAIARYCWYFLGLKILDLLDTVFMVLRKKNNQISFLHVYHHMGMVGGTWFFVKYIPGGSFVFVGTVNAFVHAVMYTYYLLTVINPEYKNSIWWKKHITELQMVQFVVTVIHCAINLLNPYCTYPKFLLGIFLPQDVFMFFMFWDFYKKAYLKPEKKE